MKLTIILSAEVANEQAAKSVYDTVKERLTDKPDVSVSGHISTDVDKIQVS